MTWWTALRVQRLHSRLAKLRKKVKKQQADLVATQGGIKAALTALGIHLNQVNDMHAAITRAKDSL